MTSIGCVSDFIFLALLLNILVICNSQQLENCDVEENDEDATLPEVYIPQGHILGVNLVSRKNRSIFGFLGVPYAKPPIGELRFSSPVAPDPWSGTLNASTDGNACPQIGDIGNEDCLYLNVFTPQLPESNDTPLLPVMVFIPGGGFATDDGDSKSYGPNYLLDEDVILVCLNYRLGPLGFFSTGDEVAPGNWGLKDQVQALRWVQDNIGYFGGDLNRVTIFGQSAGSSSVQLLALSESTIGLFHQFISQSGAAFGTWVYRPQSTYKNTALQLGEFLGCPTNTSSLLVNCLREFDFTEIINTVSNFSAAGYRYPLLMWGPTNEPDIEGAFLTDSPGNLSSAGKIRDVPSIIGTVPGEGVIFMPGIFAGSNFDDFLANFDETLISVLDAINRIRNESNFIAATKEFYYNNDLTTNRTRLWDSSVKLLTDSFFLYPVYKYLQSQFALANNNTYYYSFEYRGTYGAGNLISTTDFINTTVVHGDELIYLFPQLKHKFGADLDDLSETDMRMIDTMVQFWTSFVINGIPTTTTEISDITWAPYSSKNNCLRIGSVADASLNQQNNCYQERMQLWSELIG